MAITAAMVKELREMTGAGMMDCKKALAATEGDMDKAVEFLREKGLATAQKKAGRIAAEGLCKVLVSDDAKKAVVVEVNSETDFVAKNEKFQNYVAEVAAQALDTTAADMGVLVDVETDVINDAVKEMAKNIAMQVAAIKPVYTTRAEVDQAYIEKEKEILTVQAKNEKPDANDKIISGMVMGRINKELKEICLMDQVYVKAEDGKQSVQAYVDSVAKENGAKINIKGFVRFETGDGLEKKEENFAEEVAKQMGM